MQSEGLGYVSAAPRIPLCFIGATGQAAVHKRNALHRMTASTLKNKPVQGTVTVDECGPMWNTAQISRSHATTVELFKLVFGIEAEYSREE